MRIGPGWTQTTRGVPVASTSSARNLGEPFDPELRRRVSAPVRLRAPAEGVADEDYRRVRHGLEQRQAGGRDEKGRGQVDVDGAQPVRRLQVRERREPGKGGGGVYEAVEVSVRLRDAAGQLRVVLGTRAGEVHRTDGGRRASGLDDPIVDRLQLAHRTPEQDDLGAAARGAESDLAAEPVAGADDEHRAIREGVGCRGVVAGDRGGHREAPPVRKALREA